MVVIQYSPDALTRAAITPERLEKLYDYKLTIKDARRSSYLSGFKQVLQNTKIEKSDIGSDSRWGVILFDLKGQRIASIYLDGFGERGYVNSTPVTFITKSSNKGLSQWLNDKFLDVFR
jgi:hypothetical protein